VPDERATRVHMIMSVFTGTKRFVTRPQVGSALVAILPGETRHSSSRISRPAPSRLQCSRRARRRQCSSLRFDPAEGRAFGH
jgi:hypothetical protein